MEDIEAKVSEMYGTTTDSRITKMSIGTPGMEDIEAKVSEMYGTTTDSRITKMSIGTPGMEDWNGRHRSKGYQIVELLELKSWLCKS